MDGWMDGWIDGWMDGWKEGKAGLGIAYGNQKLSEFAIRIQIVTTKSIKTNTNLIENDQFQLKTLENLLILSTFGSISSVFNSINIFLLFIN